MSNEVDITITARDLSGPGFASALANMERLRAKAQALRGELGNIGSPEIDPNRLTSSLLLLKQKMQSLGIADITDVNINPGTLMVQLQLLKRLIQQSGISDLLDVNVNQASLQTAMSRVADITKAQTIPVSFDVKRTFIAPPTGPPTVVAGGMNEPMPNISMLNSLNDITNALTSNFAKAEVAKDKFSGDVQSKLVPALTTGWGWFGALNTRIPLFGGALGALPLIGTVGGIHLLVDGIIELAAVIIPATAAFAAFGAAAVPTVKDIYTHLQNLYTTSTALNVAIPGLSGNFQRMVDAVRPEVLNLFGQGLILINSNTSTLQTLATGAGKVIDDLGARFVYAVTTGNGFALFVRNAVPDLAKLGDIIGNLGGTLGNVLHAVPGYAQVLLTVVDDFTKLLEVTSRVAEPLIAVGLAAHGAVIYLGLAGTAASFLVSKGLIGLSNLALAGAGGLERLGLGGSLAARSLTSVGVGAAGLSTLPWGWIAVAVAGFALLAVELGKVKDAAQQFNATIEQTIQNSSLSNLNATFQAAIVATNQRVVSSSQDVTKALNGQSTAVLAGGHGLATYNQAATQAVNANRQYKDGLAAIQAQGVLVQSRVDALGRQYGGTAAALALLNAAGITSAQVTDKNNQHWAQALIEIDAQSRAIAEMTDGTQRYAAAMNALGNDFMTNQLPAIQKVTQAEDNLFNVILGGEQAFIAQQQALNQLGTDLKSTGGFVGGLSAASLTLSSDYYTSLIPSVQKTIDAVQQQGIQTDDLTKVVATSAGEALKWAGSNVAARSVIVDLINNALGPNTVSLQTLNNWVGKNSTSLQGFNSIIAESTIKAGTLANVLQQDLNAQFAQALLKSSGANQAIQNLTNAIVRQGMDSQAFAGARARLIADLENAGFSAQQARQFVQNLQNQINGLHGKSVDVNVQGSGSGGIVITATGASAVGAGNIRFVSSAAGGMVSGGVPVAIGGDNRLITAHTGEAVVPEHLVPVVAPILAAGGVPGFAAGGVVESLEPFALSHESIGAFTAVKTGVLAAVNAARKAAQAQAAKTALPTLPLGNGPLSGSAAVAQNFAKSILWAYGWGMDQWPSEVALWNQESGWNAYAVNPTSGAYGIPQALPSVWDHPYNLGDYQAQVRWGDAYISGRYGNPAAAWAHEVANNWYDNGGWLMPGLTLAHNNTGRPERVSPPDGQNIHITLEFGPNFQRATGLTQQQLADIRYEVHIRGGGDVQKAFGIPNTHFHNNVSH